MEVGLELFLSNQLDSDEAKYQIMDAMLEAALRTRNWKVYHVLYVMLSKEFENEKKLKISKANCLKALKSFNQAENNFLKMVKDNRLDGEAIKNVISVCLAEGDVWGSIERLNKYIESNPTDTEAWLELADMYMRSQDYTNALFCYEEILMITPDNLHIMNKIAEIYYTLGKKEHLKLAKKYFSFVLMSQESNTRALWGLNYTLKALQAEGSENEAEQQTTKGLLEQIPELLKKNYSHDGTNDYL